jgi:thiosulfate reductase cytochrome b subunit
MGINVWFHLVLDALWTLNGLVFIVLLFVTGQWIRIVPTSWDIVPNALSALLRYASFDWPIDNGWVNYNSLQVLAYFATVFIAAPLAILTGARLSTAWPLDAPRLNRLFNERVARYTHTAVLFYFVIFTIIHVTLVLSTGALRNLNHIFAAQDVGTWVGAAIFALALAVTIAAWVLARPKLLEALAALSGTVRR